MLVFWNANADNVRVLSDLAWRCGRLGSTCYEFCDGFFGDVVDGAENPDEPPGVTARRLAERLLTDPDS